MRSAATTRLRGTRCSFGSRRSIAESGPRQAFEPSRGADAWNGWYAGVFDFIAAHEVKIFSYINSNWDAQPLWAGQGWGDMRVQTNPYVLAQWRAKLAEPRFALSP